MLDTVRIIKSISQRKVCPQEVYTLLGDREENRPMSKSIARDRVREIVQQVCFAYS